ncbi:GGDEF domain-containing protein [Anaerotignum sp.]|uniref:GGDEF domain-containing protein n=1 Tax=Anaerotignum sp. TaxID=2039241 RepID=UPI002714D2FF|nr:GGDEF domain-containing protein [Anaerotignum sp.]
MRRIMIGVLSVALAVSFLICGVSLLFDKRKLNLNQEKITFMNDGWSFEAADGQDGEFTLPGKIPYASGKPFTIYRTFQEEVPAGTCLGFRSSHQEVFVSLDDKVIYSFEKAEDIPTFPQTPGNAWNIVTLPQIQAGQVVKFTTVSVYKQNSEKLSEVMMGSKSAILFHIAETYVMAAFMSVLVLLFALVLIFYGMYIYKIRRSANLIYLGLFALLLGIWFLGEARFLQFFCGNVLMNYQMVFLSVALMPIPSLLFLSNALQPKRQWLYNLLCVVAGVNFFVMVLVQTLGLVDFYEWIPVSHCILLLEMLLLVYTMVQCICNHSCNKSKFLFLGFGVFLFFGMLNIVYFYVSDQYDSALLLRIGTLLALVIILKGEMDKNMVLIQMGMEAAAYKKAAYTDALTQLGNRYAFDMRLKELEQMEPDERIENAICVLDVDGLKFANDSYGHWMGDQLICGMAECIQKVFSEIGNCFRIGGDEFAVVLRGEREELESYLQRLNKEITHNNMKGNCNLSASWGMAFQGDTQGNDVYEAFQMADAFMYQNKEGKKAAREAKMYVSKRNCDT